jgi:hypothetical protein
MTNNQEMIGIVEKAIKCGWLEKEIKTHQFLNRKYEIIVEIKQSIEIWVSDGAAMSELFNGSINDLIADKGFMEALYGSETVCKSCGKGLKTQEDRDVAYDFVTGKLRCLYCGDFVCMPAHQYHAQQLIILSDDERIECFKKVLENKKDT